MEVKEELEKLKSLVDQRNKINNHIADQLLLLLKEKVPDSITITGAEFEDVIIYKDSATGNYYVKFPKLPNADPIYWENFGVYSCLKWINYLYGTKFLILN